MAGAERRRGRVRQVPGADRLPSREPVRSLAAPCVARGSCSPPPCVRRRRSACSPCAARVASWWSPIRCRRTPTSSSCWRARSPTASLETARLYHAGVAPLVVLTRERLRRGAPALRAHGVFLPEEHELARQRARRARGARRAPSACVSRRAAQHHDRGARASRAGCAGAGSVSVVVVTSPTHTRRARLILRAGARSRRRS